MWCAASGGRLCVQKKRRTPFDYKKLLCRVVSAGEPDFDFKCDKRLITYTLFGAPQDTPAKAARVYFGEPTAHPRADRSIVS